GGAQRTARTDALAVRQADRRQADRGDVFDAMAGEMMAAEVARGHEGKRVWQPDFRELRPEQGGRIDVRRQIATSDLQPDDVADRRKARMQQAPAERALGREEARRQKRRRAV